MKLPPWLLAAGGVGAVAWLASKARAAGRDGWRLTLYGGAGSQLSRLTPADVAAVDECAGQVVSQTNARPLGLTMQTPGAVRAGWGYLYLRSDAEAQRELTAAVRMCDEGALQRFYPNPEAEVKAGGVASQRRLEDWMREFGRLRPNVALGYLGYTAFLSQAVAEMVDGGGPMVLPIGGDGTILSGAAGRELFVRLWRERVPAWRRVGLEPRPMVFAPGHSSGGGPDLETLAMLMRETRVPGLGLFSFETFGAGWVALTADVARPAASAGGAV